MSVSVWWPRACWRVRAFSLCLGAIAATGFGSISQAQPMRASWYGYESGRRTADGHVWRPEGLSVAHRTLPFGTRLHVSYRGRSAVCVVSDRGPAAWTGRSLDLSKGCARAIGMLAAGVATVNVERLE